MDERMQMDQMKATAENCGLCAGRAVVVKYKGTLKDGTLITRKTVRGKVLKLYPHHFAVQIGARVVCFRYNEFLGNENVKVKLKA